ncbi:MAG: hypothetical protein GX605_10890, partial [Chloroflexi bacterium]|nr:hypothetical protein [Chloroflexota bacterium]
MILRTLYVGFAVENIDRTRRSLQRVLGLPSDRLDPDPFLGTDRGARVPLPNECWLYLMESRQPDSPVARFIQRRGPGLERLAFQSDDIQGELARVRQAGVPLGPDAVADTPSGWRFVVPPEHVCGITVEVVQPKPGQWVCTAPANIGGVLALQHVGTANLSLEATVQALEQLFDLHPGPVVFQNHRSFKPGNECHWIDVAQGAVGKGDRTAQFLEEKGEGLEHIALEVADIRAAARRVLLAGARIDENK